MAIVTVDSKRCGRDGICIAECPMDLLAANQDGVPEIFLGNNQVTINAVETQ